MRGAESKDRARPGNARIAVVPIIALMLASGPEGEAATRRGAFAFHYAPSLTETQLAWYSQFGLLVTHDPLPREQVERLHAAGTRLLLYEWSVAFYDSLATEWQRTLVSRRRGALLNHTPLTGGAGSASAGAWYFDPGSDEHRFGRAEAIAQKLRRTGYDGIFLDTTTVESVHPDARSEYQRRRPDTPYDLAFSRFLSELRARLPAGIIFTNQGYRCAEFYLPYVDWDLTESLITSPRGGSFRVRPWNDPADPWNSILFLMRNVIEPLSARYPQVRVGHLNYAGPGDPRTIRLVVAVAQIFGGEGFVAAPDVSGEVDPIYFRDPGEPVAPRVDLADGQVAFRHFEHGLIAITASAEQITIANPHSKPLRDRFSREPVCGDSITLPASSEGEPLAFFFDEISGGDPAP